MEISIVKLKNTLDSLLDWVRQDLLANIDTPTKSWLYTEFNPIVLDGVNFYTHLRNMLLLGKDDTRRLETRMMFSRERANLPTLHIHYPSEDSRGGDNTINTGWLGCEESDGDGFDKYSRSFIGQYEVVITGVNSIQVVMLYEFLDALIIAAADTMAHNFDKFDISGKQLLTNPEIIPHLIFYRAITISIQAKKSVRSITSRKLIGGEGIDFEGKFYFNDLIENINLKLLESTVTSGESISVNFELTEGFVIIKWEEGVFQTFTEGVYDLTYVFKKSGQNTVEVYGYRPESLLNFELT